MRTDAMVRAKDPVATARGSLLLREFLFVQGFRSPSAPIQLR